jgi:hypothetical protein
MAKQNNIGKIDVGRAHHSVRAVAGLAKFGAHGVTRPTCPRLFETAIGTAAAFYFTEF